MRRKVQSQVHLCWTVDIQSKASTHSLYFLMILVSTLATMLSSTTLIPAASVCFRIVLTVNGLVFPIES